jgi:DNA-binding response OmpR family regulator/glycine cleavage system H lipoate-binding protein
MLDDPRLLVVDDEEAICEGCRRIFSRQGIRVEKSSDAVEGLALAASGDFSAVLLDIKMPELDGLQFLEALRVKKPDVPVILMTGYPSVPNAISAIRLGASGFVTKPFTPEEISQAVHKYLRRPAEDRAERPAAAEDGWTPAEDGVSLWLRSWLQPGKDGSVRVGTLLARNEAANARIERLPRIGEVVYQGLPLAAVRLADGTTRVVPAPVSGLVVAVHDALAADGSALAASPCRDGWIASICPTRFEEETRNCSRRNVILFNSDKSSAAQQGDKLRRLGCAVRAVAQWEELEPLLENQGSNVLVMADAGLDKQGPELVGRINAAAPTMKVILAAASECKLEAAYRVHRLFYYAIEPFADNEIAEILDAAFRLGGGPGPHGQGRKVPAGPLSNITIANRQGNKVKLLAAPGLLRRQEGLGAAVCQKLLDRLFPMETVLGDASLKPTDILKAAGTCDRLVVLVTKDCGLLPGSLVRDTKAEFISISGDGASKVTILAVQPCAAGDVACLDLPTTGALAEQIVCDMASY